MDGGERNTSGSFWKEDIFVAGQELQFRHEFPG